MSAAFNGLILAGRRKSGDVIAERAHVSHKAFASVHNMPMIAYPLRALRNSAMIESLYVCIDSAAADTLTACAEKYAPDTRGIKIISEKESPAASVANAIDVIGLRKPLLITTADHALLSIAMIAYFITHAPKSADLVIALATEETIVKKYPGTIRTFYRFAKKRYSGCNIFLCRTPAAIKVANYWRDMEKYRKKPWRIALAIGPLTIVRFALGMLSLEAALRHLSRKIGAQIAALEIPFAEAAIDIDKPDDLELVESILATSQTHG